MLRLLRAGSYRYPHDTRTLTHLGATTVAVREDLRAVDEVLHHLDYEMVSVLTHPSFSSPPARQESRVRTLIDVIVAHWSNAGPILTLVPNLCEAGHGSQ